MAKQPLLRKPLRKYWDFAGSHSSDELLDFWSREMKAEAVVESHSQLMADFKQVRED